MESLDLFYGTIPQVMFGIFMLYMFVELFFIGDKLLFIGGFIILVVVLAYIFLFFKKSLKTRVTLSEGRKLKKYKKVTSQFLIVTFIVFMITVTLNVIFFLP